MSRHPAWQQSDRDRLAQMWAAGLSTRLMAEQLGCSKNAVVGHAHRMGLERRPSPILRKPTAEVMAGASAMALAGHSATEIMRQSGISEHFAQRTVRAASEAEPYEPAEVPSLPVMPPPVPVIETWQAPDPEPERRPVPTSPCCWPIGQPGSANFRFCDAGALRTKPYCTEHAKLAYVRQIGDHEDAAA